MVAPGIEVSQVYRCAHSVLLIDVESKIEMNKQTCVSGSCYQKVCHFANSGGNRSLIVAAQENTDCVRVNIPRVLVISRIHIYHFTYIQIRRKLIVSDHYDESYQVYSFN